MTTPQSTHLSPGAPRLLREAATPSTADIVGTVIGAMAFVAFAPIMIIISELFVGSRISLLFLRITADHTVVTAVGAVAVLVFGLIAVLCGWELVRRNT